jgi:flagellar basal body-associated protein FliL
MGYSYTSLKEKSAQILIGLALLLVIGLIVGGYIYYGMQFAKNNNPDTSVVPPTATDTVRPDPLTSEEKKAVMDSLSATASATPSASVRTAVMKELSTDAATTTNTMTVEERQAVLDSLGAQ